MIKIDKLVDGLCRSGINHNFTEVFILLNFALKSFLNVFSFFQTLHSCDLHRHSSAYAIPAVSCLYFMSSLPFQLCTRETARRCHNSPFLIKQINFHCFYTCLEVIAARLVVMISVIYLFTSFFIATTHILLSSFPFPQM